MRTAQVFLCTWGLLLAGCLAGCGSSHGGVEVKGTVTLDGQPLESGSVVLVPLQGTRGPKCYALVRSGKFRIPASRGPLPGKYQVQVYSAAQLRVPMEGVEPPGDETAQGPLIPQRYNRRSERALEVGEAPVVVQLKLHSRGEGGAGDNQELN